MSDIAIFPGTFNPVHKGHLLISEQACSQFELKKVYFVLSPNPPNKLNQTNILPASSRAELLQAALKNNHNFELSLIELERENASYTFETVEYFRNKFNLEGRLKLILGFDTFLSLPSWRRIEEMKKLTHFLIAPREDDCFEIELESFYDDVYFDFIDSPLIDISSSEVRKRKKQRANYENLLSSEVFELYRAI